MIETWASTTGGPTAVRAAAGETHEMGARAHRASASARASARRRFMVCGRTVVGEWDGLKKIRGNARRETSTRERGRMGERGRAYRTNHYSTGKSTHHGASCARDRVRRS